MPTENRDTISRDLDALGKRIESRICEFKERGEFSDLHTQLAALHTRQRLLRGRLEDAGGAWDAAKRDVALEHSLIHEELDRLERRLDSEMMKEKPSGRAPGAKSGLV